MNATNFHALLFLLKMPSRVIVREREEEQEGNSHIIMASHMIKQKCAAANEAAASEMISGDTESI
jgi:hypothetical protein